MKNYSILLLLIIVTATSCKSLKTDFISENETYEIINSTLGINNKNQIKLYPRSYTNKEFGRVFILDEMKFLNVGFLGNEETRKIYKTIDSIRNSNIKKPIKDSLITSVRKNLPDIPEINDFLSNEDIMQMSKMVNTNMDWEPEKFKSNITLSKGKDAFKVSVPMLNLKKDIAAYFVESEFGLQLNFCKKDSKNNWDLYCTASVWME